jgi:hypothetical protein
MSSIQTEVERPWQASLAQATVAEPTLTAPGQDYVNIYDHIHHR